MQIFKISKKNGSFRTIYAPNPEEKSHLRWCLDHGGITREAEKKMEASGNIQHGFRPGRSAVTNAQQHRNFNYTLCFDLSDFFDSVTPQHVPEFATVLYVWQDGAARQGLPTSPALANMAACGMDMAILDMFKIERRLSIHDKIIYTRYADDLAFSFNLPDTAEWLTRSIPELVEKHGFKINPAKTHIQCAKAGVRYVTGVGIDGSKLRPSRDVRRRLRAARHQGRNWEARGLEEWCKLKLPRVVPAAPPAVIETAHPEREVPAGEWRRLNFGGIASPGVAE